MVSQANILIDGDHHVRLADFGVAVLADAGSCSGISTRSGGAARWCAPEVLKGEPSSKESDIYAFGCVCIEVSTYLSSRSILEANRLQPLDLHPRTTFSRAQ